MGLLRHLAREQRSRREQRRAGSSSSGWKGSRFDLSRPVARLGESKVWLRWRDLFEGIAISGGVGASKTSTAGDQIMRHIFAALAGAIILTTKKGDLSRYVAAAGAARRSQDVVVMRLGGDVKINIVEAAARNGGTEDIVKVIGVASRAVGGGKLADTNEDQTWVKAGDQAIRNCADLLIAAGERLSLENFAALIATAPTTKEEGADLFHLEEYLASGRLRPEDLTYFQRVWLKVGWNYRDGKISLHENTIDATQLYFSKQFPSLPAKTLGSVRFSMENSIAALTRGEIADLCTKETTFDLVSLREGKILILDLPPKTHGHAGRAIQSMLLNLAHSQLEREDLPHDSDARPVMIFLDEAHGYVGEEFIEMQSTARSARIISVLISQSISGYRRKLGVEGTTALLEVLNTKVIFCPGEKETGEWASDLIGEEWSFEPSFTSDGAISFSEQKRRIVEPDELLDLDRGGADFRYLARSFVFKPASRWGPNGENFLEVIWKQRRGG